MRFRDDIFIPTLYHNHNFPTSSLSRSESCSFKLHSGYYVGFHCIAQATLAFNKHEGLHRNSNRCTQTHTLIKRFEFCINVMGIKQTKIWIKPRAFPFSWIEHLIKCSTHRTQKEKCCRVCQCPQPGLLCCPGHARQCPLPFWSPHLGECQWYPTGADYTCMYASERLQCTGSRILQFWTTAVLKWKGRGLDPTLPQASLAFQSRSQGKLTQSRRGYRTSQLPFHSWQFQCNKLCLKLLSSQ